MKTESLVIHLNQYSHSITPCLVVTNIHIPRLPTLLVLEILMISEVPDPGTLKYYSFVQ